MTPHADAAYATPRPERTYVVLGCALPFGAGSAVTPLGTLRARNLPAAQALAPTFARARAGAAANRWAVRVIRASACRSAWLLAALARDGAIGRTGPGDGVT